MKALRQNGNAIIMCIIEAVAGILLLVNPAGLTASIIISAAVSIICALVIINNPFSSTVAFWWFTGILLIAEVVVFDVITLVMSRKNDGSAEE